MCYSVRHNVLRRHRNDKCAIILLLVPSDYFCFFYSCAKLDICPKAKIPSVPSLIVHWGLLLRYSFPLLLISSSLWVKHIGFIPVRGFVFRTPDRSFVSARHPLVLASCAWILSYLYCLFSIGYFLPVNVTHSAIVGYSGDFLVIVIFNNTKTEISAT